jgi:hypothetical protein
MAPDALARTAPARRRASGMRHRAAGWALALAALALSTAARADYFYTCKDKAGHPFSGNLPPPECKDVDIREQNPDGTLHRLIPAPLTREQRRQRDLEAEEQMKKEEADRAQARRDRALLETYGSADEIEAARQRGIAGQQMLIDRADQRIAQYQKERKRLDDEAEFYKNREMPTKLKEAFDANQVLMQQQQETRTKSLNQVKAINERFDAEKKRYLELEDMAAKAAAARDRESVVAPQE